MRNVRTFAITLSFVAALGGSPAHAQKAGTPELGPAPTQSFSVKPLNAIFGAYSGEYERALSGSNTLGILGSTFGIGDVRYVAIDGKYRHYFSGTAFQGFSLAGTGGMVALNIDCYESDGSACTDERFTGAAAGVELGYTFLLGTNRNWTLSLDAGAQRIFPLGEIREETDGFWFAMPTGGISIGWAPR
jgi:hypothetical protein